MDPRAIPMSMLNMQMLFRVGGGGGVSLKGRISLLLRLAVNPLGSPGSASA